MRVYVEGVGLLGPGLNDWQSARAVLRGETPYVAAPAVMRVCDLLPAAERRRAGVAIRLAVAVGQEAFLQSGCDLATTATVFASSGGDNDNVHAISEILASAPLEVSPTRFHNSVHNAAAGYWSIAAHSMEPSTSLAAYDGSFSAGLLEAAVQVVVDGAAVALIAYDHPFPEPLNAVRHISGVFGVALILAPQASENAFAALDVEVVSGADKTEMVDPALSSLCKGIPAARSLPLLQLLARGAAGEATLEFVDGNALRVAVTPC